ncbi:MAG: FAD-dependent oxidoreductase, partial [Burkholderiaceae bacterium]|nr:FAD-dependent oxidoreductase [Burkholderiaceae bacterium]
TGTTEVFKTGTWRAWLPRYISAPTPCHLACPVDGDIAQWIGRARERDFRGAWEILTRNNPFPAVAGRVCHHPCETACNRMTVDEPLSICKLERHLGDLALANGWSYPPPEESRAECVAVVGGGPAGLSAAYHLRRRGYAVTLFEAAAELGGLMRDGIPAYRLPREVLDGEIQRIVDLGVEVRCREPLDSPGEFQRLRDEFDAVFLAIGARRPKRLAQLDHAQPWVVDGAEWLAQANAGEVPALGHRLVVIGGGSAAIDVARSARRAGHEVSLLALEPQARMPAQREEVEEALEEGVRLVDRAMLSAATWSADAGVVLDCVQVDFIAGAERGRFSVEPIAGSGFRLEADAIVTSIGQDPELSQLPPELPAQGGLLHVDRQQATGVAGVYAGGDVASLARFVTEAIGMGKRAALAIDAALRAAAGGAGADADAGSEARLAGARLQGLGAPVNAVVSLESIAGFYYPPAARVAVPRLDVGQRLASLVEVQPGFDLEQALAEAQRCFSCGTCIHCDNCFHYCPDLAIRRVGDGYEVDGDYCKGCGVCVRECPTGSMEMVEELR